jgi:hypothetical protein
MRVTSALSANHVAVVDQMLNVEGGVELDAVVIAAKPLVCLGAPIRLSGGQPVMTPRGGT